eukprot:Platyproteum_vivax@DN12494_c0_g1_i1.p1
MPLDYCNVPSIVGGSFTVEEDLMFRLECCRIIRAMSEATQGRFKHTKHPELAKLFLQRHLFASDPTKSHFFKTNSHVIAAACVQLAGKVDVGQSEWPQGTHFTATKYCKILKNCIQNNNLKFPERLEKPVEEEDIRSVETMVFHAESEVLESLNYQTRLALPSDSITEIFEKLINYEVEKADWDYIKSKSTQLSKNVLQLPFVVTMSPLEVALGCITLVTMAMKTDFSFNNVIPSEIRQGRPWYCTLFPDSNISVAN